MLIGNSSAENKAVKIRANEESFHKKECFMHASRVYFQGAPIFIVNFNIV